MNARGMDIFDGQERKHLYLAVTLGGRICFLIQEGHLVVHTEIQISMITAHIFTKVRGEFLQNIDTAQTKLTTKYHGRP